MRKALVVSFRRSGGARFNLNGTGGYATAIRRVDSTDDGQHG